MRRLVFALGLVALCVSIGLVVERLRHVPSTAAVDLLPLWLGARALLAGLDPNDPAVQEQLFREAGLRMRVGGFWSYYPPTAALLALPSGWLSFSTFANAWRYAAVGMIALAGALGAGRWTWAPWIAAALLQLRVSWVVLPSGQPGPLAAMLTAAAILALARRRDGVGGALVGLGAAVKLVPLALLPVLLATRRWRSLAVSVGVLGVGMLGVLALAPGWSPSAWWGGLYRFVDAPAFEPWLRQEPAWVLALWRARVVGPGIGTLVLCAWAAWTRRDPPGLLALAVAWVGAVMAGSHHYHEALVLLPALGWALARGGLVTAVSVGLVVAFRVWDPRAPPSALHWVPVAWGVWGLIAGTVVRDLWAQARPPG